MMGFKKNIILCPLKNVYCILFAEFFNPCELRSLLRAEVYSVNHCVWNGILYMVWSLCVFSNVLLSVCARSPLTWPENVCARTAFIWLNLVKMNIIFGSATNWAYEPFGGQMRTLMRWLAMEDSQKIWRSQKYMRTQLQCCISKCLCMQTTNVKSSAQSHAVRDQGSAEFKRLDPWCLPVNRENLRANPFLRMMVHHIQRSRPASIMCGHAYAETIEWGLISDIIFVTTFSSKEAKCSINECNSSNQISSSLKLQSETYTVFIIFSPLSRTICVCVLSMMFSSLPTQGV